MGLFIKESGKIDFLMVVGSSSGIWESFSFLLSNFLYSLKSLLSDPENRHHIWKLCSYSQAGKHNRVSGFLLSSGKVETPKALRDKNYRKNRL